MPRPPKGYIPEKCAGKNKSGERCKRWSMRDSVYCCHCSKRRRESTQFKPGPLNPAFINGNSSTAVPKALGSAFGSALRKSSNSELYEYYQVGLNDSELLAQRDEIALVRAKLIEQIERAESINSEETWEELTYNKKQFQLYMGQPGKGNEAKAHEALEKMIELIEHGSQESKYWKSIERKVALLDKLKVSERRRLMEMKAFVTITEAIAMLQTITHTLHQVVPKEVADETAKQRILDAVAGQIEKMLTAGELATGKDAA